jgi:hypothetical protein
MMGQVYKISTNTNDETEKIKARFLATKKSLFLSANYLQI